MNATGGPGSRPLGQIHKMMVEELVARETKLCRLVEQAEEVLANTRMELREVRKDLRSERKRANVLGVDLALALPPAAATASVHVVIDGAAALGITDEDVIEALQDAGEELTREQIGDRLPHRKGLHLKLAKMVRQGDLTVIERGDHETRYAAVV